MLDDNRCTEQNNEHQFLLIIIFKKKFRKYIQTLGTFLFLSIYKRENTIFYCSTLFCKFNSSLL